MAFGPLRSLDTLSFLMDVAYDYAIVGGGCAGFQLLYHLAQQPHWRNRRVLLLTDDRPMQRSWCFWSRDRQPPLHHLIEKSWPSITFRSPDFSRTQTIAPYNYHYLSGDAFFSYFAEQFLPRHRNITHVVSYVNRISRMGNDFVLTAGNHTWRAKQVFSSQLPPVPAETRFRLWQHFGGWFVRTDRPVFDTHSATLMDFTIPQRGAVQFGYVLPFSSTHALVEVTAFSPAVYSDAQYHELLTDYIGQNWPGVPFSVEAVEQGQIPMTDFPFDRYGPAGEILIGTAAGMVKATTGYAFRRIALDSLQLAQQLTSLLEANKRSIRGPATTGRFRFYDRLLLGIITQEPALGLEVFSELFRHSSFPDILRFLDEESDLLTEAKLISRLPFKPFLTQLMRQWLDLLPPERYVQQPQPI